MEKLKAGKEKEHLFDEAKANLLDNSNVKLLGRFLIRAGLWLVKKEGKGRKQKVYGSLTEIHAAYLQEKSQGTDNAASSSAGGSQKLAENRKQGLWRPSAAFKMLVCKPLPFPAFPGSCERRK